MSEIRQFVKDHGHCRIPVNHPILGDFVKLARRDHKLWKQGRKSGMTTEREKQLMDLGFVFEGGKTPTRSADGKKSWEEHFQELV